MRLAVTSLVSSHSDHFLAEMTVTLRATGHDAVFLDGDWEQRLAALRSGEAVAGWVCGLLHNQLRSQGDWPYLAVAAPVSLRPATLGQPVYFGDIVVARDSTVTEFAHLAGGTFAFNEEVSLSGYRMMLDHLATFGGDLSFFGDTMRSGSHLESLRLVAEGTAQCAIIDSTLMDDAVPGAESVRTVASVGPYPAPPLVVAPGYADAILAGLPSGWVQADEARYELLRAPQ